MIILGICHDVYVCSACITVDGRVVVAIPEERLDRVKQSRCFPVQAIAQCLQEAKLTMIPKTTMKIEGSQARTTLKLMDLLEDCEDVQNVYSNFDLSEEAMAEAMAD